VCHCSRDITVKLRQYVKPLSSQQQPAPAASALLIVLQSDMTYTDFVPHMRSFAIMDVATHCCDYQVPTEQFYKSDQAMALPKLNLQFLTLHDYLLRSFNLYRLESAYEIRYAHALQYIFNHYRSSFGMLRICVHCIAECTARICY
jgi:Intron-binding protein aquarius N-terminus